MSTSSSKTESVQVCVRTRPTTQFAAECLAIDSEKKSISVHLPKLAGQHINNQQEDWNFTFSHILHDASQEQVYDTVANDIVMSVMDGYNGTILAYGQTGAGKTYTMNGGTRSYAQRGIIPRAIGHIFRTLQSRTDIAVIVRCSYLEVYNDEFYDLLDEHGSILPDLAVREDEMGSVNVKGLKRIQCDREEDALNLLFEGETNRAIADHEMNAASTRSHCIFTIYLETRSRVESSEKVILSKLNLVDLAGSERVGKTGSTGTTLQEAKYINKSLTFLEQVVIALSSKHRDHIPFRQSKLTNVLRDSLGGNCKTRMIANIWCERPQMEETISTLKFATRMMRVSNQATINIQLDPVLLLKKYERDIRELRQELAMHDTLANRGVIHYEAYTPEEQAEMKTLVTRYIKGEIEEIEIINLRQIRELFRQFRAYAHDLEDQFQQQSVFGGNTLKSSSSGRLSRGTSRQDGGNGNENIQQQTSSNEDGMVGDLDEHETGFSIGHALSHAKPVSRPDSRDSPLRPKNIRRAKEQALSASPSVTQLTKQREESKEKSNSHSNSSVKLGVTRNIPNEQDAFEEYKMNDGHEQNEIWIQTKADLKSKKRTLKELSLEINAIKHTIDDLTAKIAEKRATRDVGTGDIEVMDEDEYEMVRQVRAHKKQYQSLYQQRTSLQDEITYITGLVEQAKLTLCQNFLSWYTSTYGEEEVKPAEKSGWQTRSVQNGEDEDIQKVMEMNPDAASFYNARKHLEGLKKKKRHSQGARKPREATTKLPFI